MSKKIVIKLTEDGTIDWAASNLGEEVEIYIVEDDLCGEPNCKIDGEDGVEVNGTAIPNEERVNSLELM